MDGKELTPRASSSPVILDLSSGIDISHLPKETQDEIRKYALMKQIDLSADREKLKTDLSATSAAIGNMADVTGRMTASGDTVTIRKTIINTAGQTEVLMGNSQEARRGSVNPDGQMWPYVVGGVILMIVIAAVVGN